MKIKLSYILAAAALLCTLSCQKIGGISGEQSDLGKEGATLNIRVDGISNVDVKCVNNSNGVSTFEGDFKMTDERYMKIIKNYPKYFDVTGDKVHVHDVKFKITDKGIENVSGENNGIIIKYNAKVGDTYSKGRKVTHVSTENDYSWSFMKIKVIKVEGDCKENGVKHVTYYGNHKFGIVAVDVDFEDGTSDHAPVYLDAPRD